MKSVHEEFAKKAAKIGCYKKVELTVTEEMLSCWVARLSNVNARVGKEKVFAFNQSLNDVCMYINFTKISAKMLVSGQARPDCSADKIWWVLSYSLIRAVLTLAWNPSLMCAFVIECRMHEAKLCQMIPCRSFFDM